MVNFVLYVFCQNYKVENKRLRTGESEGKGTEKSKWQIALMDLASMQQVKNYIRSYTFRVCF